MYELLARDKTIFRRVADSEGSMGVAIGERGALAIEPLFKARYPLSADINFIIVRMHQIHL